MNKPQLDPATLLYVVRSQRARMRRNAHHWDNQDWVHMESFLERLLKKAHALSPKRPATKKGKR